MDLEDLGELTQLLAYSETYIGGMKLKCGVDKVVLAPSMGTHCYRARVGQEKRDFMVATDNSAVKEGMRLIGEMLYDRLNAFEGNPFAYTVIEGSEEEDERL
jgi:hypothetical protein